MNKELRGERKGRQELDMDKKAGIKKRRNM